MVVGLFVFVSGVEGWDCRLWGGWCCAGMWLDGIGVGSGCCCDEESGSERVCRWNYSVRVWSSVKRQVN